ncbi:MAG TPA: hypothetical protein VLF18_17375 [Tahibacter sp.]|uniref:hypothetical protein n=1 Tax=Tahibacter sp. TaxID=2056211 RepID=UPI002C8AF9CF|nr:hypothetical protein [Tahibacter sp.]HSX61961.1 hypothetical protein [Tahibacter sp.]
MKTSTAAVNTGSNLRTRLYWVWQAWRLRKVAAAETANAAGVFMNFAAMEQRGHADSLCELAEALSMSTPGLVGTTADDVRKRLRRELGPRACAVVLGAGRHVTGGYAWGRVEAGTEALASLRLLPSLAAVAERDWGAVAAALGERDTLVLSEIGLDPSYRYGFSPLKQLLKPLFDLGVAQSARRALWWAPRSSPICGLSLAFGARAVGTDDGVAFFVQHDVAAIARILNALSAGEISALLARVGPPRQARTRIDALPAHVTARLAAAHRAAADRYAEEPEPTFANYTAAIAAADYPGVAARSAANDEDGEPADSDRSPSRRAAAHPPLQALPQRLSALFPRRAG